MPPTRWALVWPRTSARTPALSIVGDAARDRRSDRDSRCGTASEDAARTPRRRRRRQAAPAATTRGDRRPLSAPDSMMRRCRQYTSDRDSQGASDGRRPAGRPTPDYVYNVATTSGAVMENPFVYGEVVPAAAFVDRVAELDRLVGRPGRRAEDLPDLAPPLRQVVARSGAPWRRWRERGALTVEVTVSSFSSYVAFLEGYARALLAAETRWDRARTGCATRSGRRGPRSATRPRQSPLGALTVVVPERAHRARRLAARAGGVRAAGPARRSAPAQGRRRARRVPGHRRLQRRLGRARACAPRSSISATSATCSPARSRA